MRVVAAMIVPLLGACGGAEISDILPDRRPDYRRTVTLESLEVPPDLTSSTIDDTLLVPELGPAGSASFSDYASERGSGGVTSAKLLPEPDDVKIVRDGQKRWLQVEQPPDKVWKTLKRFWEDNGFLLVKENKTTGVMETQWSENREDIPDDPVRSVLSSSLGFLYSSSNRDKFRTRIEPGQQPGSTDVYLTHYGMQEVQRGESQVIWQPRPQDPELEAEMLRRLMVFIGISDDRAQQMLADRQGTPGERAVIHQSVDGYPFLSIDEALPRAWQLVGLSLERNSFTIEDSDRSRGTYLVRYRPPEGDDSSGGVLASLAFWKEEPGETAYTIRLEAESRIVTAVAVLDDDGQESASETARAILDVLQEDLK